MDESCILVRMSAISCAERLMPMYLLTYAAVTSMLRLLRSGYSRRSPSASVTSTGSTSNGFEQYLRTCMRCVSRPHPVRTAGHARSVPRHTFTAGNQIAHRLRREPATAARRSR
jgi:hypothetical protein